MTARRGPTRVPQTRTPIPAQASFMSSLRFRPSHVHAMAVALQAQFQAEARERMRLGGKGGKISTPSRARDQIGAQFGISGRQVEKIGDICRAAEADPETFGHLLAEMDRTGKVNGPHTKLKRLLDAQRVRTLAPVDGTFHTLVLDVPWDEDNISDSSGHDYALMTFEQILALKSLIDAWADPAFTHLWFWATNNTLPLAFQAIAHYGFAYKTTHTWVKSRWGRGRYARNTTEHVLFAIRGEQGCAPAFMSTPTHHGWPTPAGPESTKPDGFYDMVRALSFGPYGEAFQRTARPDFVGLYEPAIVLEAAE